MYAGLSNLSRGSAGSLTCTIKFRAATPKVTRGFVLAAVRSPGLAPPRTDDKSPSAGRDIRSI
jgi:hypothetical protein